MTSQNSELRTKIIRTIKWLGFLPIITIWPFISAFPAFGLFSASDTKIALIEIGFFLTGFWAIAGAVPVVWFILRREARSRIRSLMSTKRLFIGIYATLWTAAYALFAFGR